MWVFEENDGNQAKASGGDARRPLCRIPRNKLRDLQTQTY